MKEFRAVCTEVCGPTNPRLNLNCNIIGMFLGEHMKE